MLETPAFPLPERLGDVSGTAWERLDLTLGPWERWRHVGGTVAGTVLARRAWTMGSWAAQTSGGHGRDTPSLAAVSRSALRLAV